MSHQETSSHPHAVSVRIAATADPSCLLKLVSVIHARGVSVTDLSYRRLPDGSSALAARFRSTTARASLLVSSLRRYIHVTEVTEVAEGIGPLVVAEGARGEADRRAG